MIKGKKIFILGMARSGYEAAKLLATNNKVIITDMKDQDKGQLHDLKRLGVKFIKSDDPTEFLDESFDILVKNPGIKYTHKTVVKANNLNIPVINEVEAAFYYMPKGVHIIGVTGSNGKTTTVTLIYNFLKNAGKNVYLGGNIGYPLSGLVKKLKKKDYLVLEISDHQLCDMYKFKTEVSVLNNIFEAHTDFHDSHERYKAMKKRIFNNHTKKDYAIINYDNKESVDLTSDIKSTKIYFSKDSKQRSYIKNNYIYYANKKVISLDDIKIKGMHNYENIMAAICAVKLYAIPNEPIVRFLKSFSGVEHRIEYVKTINGVKYYNDSKATNVESTKTALVSFKEPIVLMLGGLDRGHSFDDLIPYLKNVKYISAFGETKDRIKKFATKNKIECDVYKNLKEATIGASKKASYGDVVLFSPACASWDSYENFEIRGDEFKSVVNSFKDESIENYKNVYMIGIGGISMSGIAEIIKNYGYNVSGSDLNKSSITEKLEKNGIKVNYSQLKKNITKDIDLVVYTAAIKDDNKELIKARELGIKCMERADYLGEITKHFSDTIGISGTHGKTTTTSMLSSVFIEAGLDPTIQVGTNLNLIDGNYRIGKSEHLIIEACEYHDSYLKFKQKSAIVLNIDDDHLDYFKNINNIEKSFQKYVSNLPSDGYLVLNMDDERVYGLKDYTKAKVITIGSDKKADYYFKDVSYSSDGFPCFDVYHNNKKIDILSLKSAGIHNVYNSLCVYALAKEYGIDSKIIKKALLKPLGVSRRLEYKGKFNGASVYDDYGHHPTELEATYNGIKNKKYNKSFIIFEAHTFSRLKAHLKEFAKVLINYDNIIIVDIYAAREQNTYDIGPEDLIKEIKKLKKDALYIKDYDEIVKYLLENVKKDDIIITQGAGNITKLASKLTK